MGFDFRQVSEYNTSTYYLSWFEGYNPRNARLPRLSQNHIRLLFSISVKCGKTCLFQDLAIQEIRN